MRRHSRRPHSAVDRVHPYHDRAHVRVQLFPVHETLFVPRELGGAVISYEIESRHPVAVQLSFVPVLDLMWPVGFGGQELSWKPDENAYEMHEPTGRFHAVFGGPDVVLHDDLVNTDAPLESARGKLLNSC